MEARGFFYDTDTSHVHMHARTRTHTLVLLLVLLLPELATWPHLGSEPAKGNKTGGPVGSGDTSLISQLHRPLSAVGVSSLACKTHTRTHHTPRREQEEPTVRVASRVEAINHGLPVTHGTAAVQTCGTRANRK